MSRHVFIVAGWDAHAVTATASALCGWRSPGWELWSGEWDERAFYDAGRGGIPEVVTDPHMIPAGTVPPAGIEVSSLLIISPGVPLSKYETATARLSALGRFTQDTLIPARLAELARWANIKEASTNAQV